MDAHFIQLRPDLIIRQAEIFQTNTSILQTSEGYLLIDPAFTQADLEHIAAFCHPQPILAGFSTHAHYDHLFWSPLFGDETPIYCSEGTLAYIGTHHQEILDELIALENKSFSINRHYFSKHLSHLSSISVGLHYLHGYYVEVIEIPGHLHGQSAFWFPKVETLFAADTLSDIEPPSIEGSRQSLLDYLESLEKLEKLIRQAQWIIPGHGSPANSAEANARLHKDRRYLRALLSLRAKDFAGSVELLARTFLERIQETRAETPDAWQMHKQNLIFARQWL